MIAALTNESATSKSVYFAHCTSEMIFITHLIAEEPEKLAGPLLADTYVTLLKGRNAWYGQKLAKGELSLEMGDSIKGKGMIQVGMLINLKDWSTNRLQEIDIEYAKSELTWKRSCIEKVLCLIIFFKDSFLSNPTNFDIVSWALPYFLPIIKKILCGN